MPTFSVTWTDFTVLKKHDIDRDKPYLWVIGIVVDQTAIDAKKYVIRRPHLSDNLGQKFKKGDRSSVPDTLDISRDIKPFAGMAMGGVVVVAWENGMTKDSLINEAYDAAADLINDYVRDLVEELLAGILSGDVPLDDIKVEIDDSDVEQLQDDIVDKVTQVIKAGAKPFPINPDHYIGVNHTVVSLGEEFNECLDWQFSTGSTTYNLDGELAYRTAKPSYTPPRDVDIPPKLQEPKPTSTVRH